MAAELPAATETGTSRIAPGRRSDVGWLNWAISRTAGLAAGTGPPHLFLTLGRHRRLFRAWLPFAGRLMPRGRLPRRDTELAILRVARLRSCEYELRQHVTLAERAGLRSSEVARTATGPGAPEWSDRQRSILTAVDALHQGEVDDATWSGLRAHLEDVEAIELCMLVGHYEMLATVIAALQIEPDERARLCDHRLRRTGARERILAVVPRTRRRGRRSSP